MKSLKFTLLWVNLLVVQHTFGLLIEARNVEQPPIRSGAYSSDAQPSEGFKVKLSRCISNPETDSIPVPETTYLGPIGLGSSDEQVFKVLFDVNSHNTWVPYKKGLFTDLSGLHYSDGYNPSKSTTYLDRDIKYEINYKNVILSCYSYNDTCTIFENGDIRSRESLLCTNSVSFLQSFCAAYDTSIDILKEKPFDGVVGLSPMANQKDGSLSFLLSLLARQQGREDGPIDTSEEDFLSQMSDFVFGVWFNPDRNSLDRGGEITFGGVDENKLGDYLRVQHSTVNENSWDLALLGVSIGGELVSCPAGCNVRPSTIDDYIFGPPDDMNKIYQMLEVKTHLEFSVPIVGCDSIRSLPNITFQIDNSDYELTPNDYVREFFFKQNGEKQKFCQLILRPHDESNWILGVSFLSRYYTIFDQARRQIRFVKARQLN